MDRLISPIIFIGTGRSGTTIISEIVFRHKDLAFPSNYQMKFVKHTQINVLRQLFDNKLWRFHGQIKQLNRTGFFNKISFRPAEAYNMWDYLSEEINFSKNFLIDVKAQNQEKLKVRKYFYNLVKYQNKKRLAFKITGPSRLEYLLSIFPDARIVNITRNEIPTISSFLKVGFWKNNSDGILKWKGAYNNKELKWVIENKENLLFLTAFQIKKVKDITKIEVEKLKPNYSEFKYEDFLSNPIKTVKEILKFLELHEDEACINAFDELKIYNRNLADSDYFNEKELGIIKQVFH